ncbi:hypothetical protein MTR67_038711 [Solanum verrucosum]|uniref:Uncharacterized protein n=1 Tax=Solanum verrucosum TaxID=315347 RepID=A0AAF0UGZ3_SOLVR|nr:hypothetical protein MTR67_038711 [Solanum verrucosum]
MFAREALFSLASAVGTPLQVDKATTDSTHVEFDRSNSVVEYTQFDVFQDKNLVQYEGLHVTDELYAESGNTLDLDKQIEKTGKLKQCCHDEHTNQQAPVTHENEFIVTEKIDGKEINPNTPTMFILDQEVATNNLNESKKKRGGKCFKMGRFS